MENEELMHKLRTILLANESDKMGHSGVSETTEGNWYNRGFIDGVTEVQKNIDGMFKDFLAKNKHIKARDDGKH
jgi:uncharacterized protein (UPF0332 family)